MIGCCISAFNSPHTAVSDAMIILLFICFLFNKMLLCFNLLTHFLCSAHTSKTSLEHLNGNGMIVFVCTVSLRVLAMDDI